MNKEVKEILEYLKKSTNSKDFCGMMITKNNLDKILDYITNLQEENERLKKQLNCKEFYTRFMPENTEWVILTKADYDRQEKNAQDENIILQQRIDKAIEYIKSNEFHCKNQSEQEKYDYDLLKILGGDE